MTDSQRGKYIMLLCLQHQQGLLSEEDMLNICKTYDKKIFSKFIKTEQGLYYNERMKIEAEKRKKYSDSRRSNRTNISKSYDKHMENENEDIIKIRKRSPFKIPEIEEVKKYFDDNGYKPEVGEEKWHYYNDANWFDAYGNPVLSWKQKMRQVWFKPEYKKVNGFVMQLSSGPGR